MKRFTSALALALVTLTGPAATAREVGPAPEVLAASTRSVAFSEGHQQLASGELAVTNLDSYSYALDLATLSIFNLCVRNYRATAASDVWIEIWASNQIPQIGGDLTHHTVSTYSFGLLSGLSQRCLNTGAIPMTPPNPGVYWVSIVVYEGSGAGRQLQFIYTDPEKGDFGGPFYGGTLHFDTPANYFVTSGGANASLQVSRIRNTGSSTSRQLRLELWASTTLPRYGGTIHADTLIARNYSPLLPGYQYSNVDTGSLATSPPPAGTYWITAALMQLGTDGTTWYYACIYTFPNRYTFTTAPSPAPVADFTFSPSSPQPGQGVSFTDTSSGSPTSWSWSFGDGGTSSARNPTHAFAAAGSYAVTLTATNASGSNARTKTVTVTAPAPTVPVISYFGANPPAVVPGQQATLTWTSTGGTSAFIDQGVGAVPTSGSRTLSPVVGVPYRLTVTGPGGSATAQVTVTAVPAAYAGTWILPSSARAPGANAFWTTDLTVTNAGTQAATVTLKFLGHEGAGATGPERTYSIPARATFTWPDVLSSVFGRTTDWGPILLRSTVATLVAQGQTFTASPTGGSYGQSVPALGPSEAVGAASRTLAGVRQDSQFRTNVVLANLKETSATVTLQVLLPDGTTATSHTTTVGPLGFVQLNLQSSLGVTNLVGGSILVSSSTPGAEIAAYASVIDAATADPRTILAR